MDLSISVNSFIEVLSGKSCCLHVQGTPLHKVYLTTLFDHAWSFFSLSQGCTGCCTSLSTKSTAYRIVVSRSVPCLRGTCMTFAAIHSVYHSFILICFVLRFASITKLVPCNQMPQLAGLI